MIKLKHLATVALLFCMSAVFAQENKSNLDYEPYPYGFVSVQGGGQTTFTNYDASKLITPVGAISVGGFGKRGVGARIQALGWKNQGALRATDYKYDYNFVTTNLDLMFNLTDMFCGKHEKHPLNVILLGGMGLSYAWGNDDLNAYKTATGAVLPLSWEDDRLVHNFRAGIMLEGNVSKHLGINFEVAANNLHDRFNSKLNGRGDWQLTAMVGLTYKFGFKKRKVVIPPPVVPEPVVEETPAPVVEEVVPVPAPEPEPTPAPTPVVVEEVEKPEVMNDNVFFEINSAKISKTEAEKVKQLAEWLKANPETKVNITGYADAGTGNDKINLRLSKKRVNAVAKMLTGTYDIPADRITQSAKGSKEQPFTQNDKNRVVVMVAK